ncbi:MAG: outer membrane protein assembly factor BamD [Vicinamibacterales bacterium]
MAFVKIGARVRVPSLASFRQSSGVRLFCVALYLSLAVACSSAPKRPPVGSLEPDKFLHENGAKALNEKRWFVAREYFRQLVDSYPQSPYRADAKLGIADTYLGERTIESQVLAISEYREFLSFYPTHDRADYAQFKLGMAHVQQMKGPERDQTETKEAIAELTTFMQRYPKSALAPDGRQQLREAKDRLSMSEYRVGVFYYRQRWYPGAADRLTAVLKNDPEFTYRDGVYFHLAQVFLKNGRPAEALPYLDKLVSEFDKSEYLAEAQKQMAAIKSGPIKPVK